MRRVWKSLRDEELPTVRVSSDDDSARHKRPTRSGLSESTFTAFKVEDLTKRERTSRMLHHGLQREKLRTGMPMVEHFFIVGAKPSRGQLSSGTTSPVSEVLQPTILFQYPPGPLDEATQAVPTFCFPEGFVPQKIVKKSRRHTKEGTHTPSRLAMMAANLLGTKPSTPVESSLQPTVTLNEEDFVKRYNRKTVSNSSSVTVPNTSSTPSPEVTSCPTPPNEPPARPTRHHRRATSDSDRLMTTLSDSYLSSENSFVFLLTGHAELRNGICVMKDYIADANENDIVIQPVCFCIVTAAPFLNFHHDFLIALHKCTPQLCDIITLDPERLERLLLLAETAAQKPVPAAELPPPLNARPDNPDSGSATPVAPTVVTPRNVCAPKTVEEAQKAMESLDALAKSPSGQSSMSDSYELQFARALLNIVQYCSLCVPEEQHPLPFYVGCGRVEMIECSRPPQGSEEESELIMQYAGEVLFRALPLKVIIQLLTALLLEYKVVLVSSHPKLLTTAVLALVPLCRPYEVAASIIPIMPKSLLPYLDAPIPLLVGLTAPPPQESINAMDSLFCVVNLHTAQLTTTKPLPALPDQATLIHNVEDFMKHASISQPSSRGLGNDIPEKIFVPTMSVPQRSFLSAMFQGHFTEFVQDFERHCISDVGSSTSTTTVFIKESFVMTKDESQHEFLNAFLETQMFKVYEDKKLRDLDREKTEHRNSLRNGRRCATTRPANEHRPTRNITRPQGRVVAPPTSAASSEDSSETSPAPELTPTGEPAKDEPSAKGEKIAVEEKTGKEENTTEDDKSTKDDDKSTEDKDDSKDDKSEKDTRRRHRRHHRTKEPEEN